MIKSNLKKCVQRLVLASFLSLVSVVAMAGSIDFENHTIRARIGESLYMPYRTAVETAEGDTLFGVLHFVTSADQSVALLNGIRGYEVMFVGEGHTTLSAIYVFDGEVPNDTVVWDVSVGKGKCGIWFSPDVDSYTYTLIDTCVEVFCQFYVPKLGCRFSQYSNSQYYWNMVYLDRNLLTFSSADTTIVKVDAGGKLTPVRLGETVITAAWEGNDQWDGDTASCVVRVEKVKLDCYVDYGSWDITFGEPYTNPAVSVSDEGVNMIFSSSDTTVVTIDSITGVLTPIAEGTATISVSYAGDDYYAPYERSWTVGVHKQHIGLELLNYYTGIEYGNEVTCNVSTRVEGNFQITYRSEDDSIATVDAVTGRVTTVGIGQTRICAFFAGDDTHASDSDFFCLEVYKYRPLKSFDTYYYEVDMLTETMEAPAINGGEGLPHFWTSSNPYVATVDSVTGKVTILHSGGADISVTCPEGEFNVQQSVSYRLRVVKLNALHAPVVKHNFMDVGQTMQAPDVTDYDGLPLVWSSSDESVVKVDSSTGELTAVGVGKAVIKVSLKKSDIFNNQSFSYDVEVFEPLPDGYAHYMFTPTGLGNGGQNITESDFIDEKKYGCIVPVATTLGWDWGVNSDAEVKPELLTFNVDGRDVVSVETSLYTIFRLTGNLRRVKLGKACISGANCLYTITVQSARGRQVLGSKTFRSFYDAADIEITSDSGIDLNNEELLITITSSDAWLARASCRIEDGILLSFKGELKSIEDAGTDGLESVEQPVAGDVRDIYNLKGQRVDDVRRGIVLMNGRKVIKTGLR